MFPHVITPFSIKRFKSHFLVVNILGRWVLLEPTAYHDFLRGTLPDTAIQELTEQGILYDFGRFDCVDEHMINSLKPYLGGPHLHIIPVTTGCNLDCVYCRTSEARAEGPANPSLDKLTRIVDFALSGPQRKIFLEFGIGEPLLRPRILLELMSHAKTVSRREKKEIVFKVTTNGTRLNESIIQEFREFKVQIGVSLDGPKHLHDRQRPSKDGTSSYETASRWLQVLLEQDYPVIRPSVTVTRWNVPYIDEIIDEYAKLGLESIALRFVGCQGSAEDKRHSILIGNTLIRKYLPEALRMIVNLNAQGVRLRENYLSLFCEKLFDPIQPAHTELMSPCGFAIGQLAYSPDGTVYGCEECLSAVEFPLGHVETDTLEKILSRPTVGKILKHSFLDHLACAPCSYLPFCGQCPVITYQQTNSFLPIRVHSNRCTTTRIYCDFIFDSIMNRDSAFRAYCENFGYSWRSLNNFITKLVH